MTGKTIMNYDKLNQNDLTNLRWFWSLIVYVYYICIDKYQTMIVPIFDRTFKNIIRPYWRLFR